MDNVHVVYQLDYDHMEIVGVADSKELAEEMASVATESNSNYTVVTREFPVMTEWLWKQEVIEEAKKIHRNRYKEAEFLIQALQTQLDTAVGEFVAHLHTDSTHFLITRIGHVLHLRAVTPGSAWGRIQKTWVVVNKESIEDMKAFITQSTFRADVQTALLRQIEIYKLINEVD